MKKTIQFSLFALFTLFSFSGCGLFTSKEGPKKDAVVPIITGLDANNIGFSWKQLPEGQTMKVRWKSESGKISGQAIAKGNELVVSPRAAGEILLFSFTPMQGDREFATYSSTISIVLADPIGRIAQNDTVGTVDVILRSIAQARTVNETWCPAQFGECTAWTDCYGTWFQINRSAADEVYRLTIQGSNRSGVATTVTLLLTVDSTGNVEYVTSGQLACVTANPVHLTMAGRFTIYDNGDFAFAMNATQSTNTVKGILVQPLKNMLSLRIEKMGGCL